MKYCKNCRNFISKDTLFSPRKYNVCYPWDREELGTGRMVPFYDFAESKNRENDCEDYERKWWKFWIKE